MKKSMLGILCCCGLLLGMAACSGSSSSTAETSAASAETSAAATEAQTVGILSKVGKSETKLNAEERTKVRNEAAAQNLDSQAAAAAFKEYRYYDNFNSLEMALEAGAVNYICVPKVVANYMVTQGKSINMTLDRIMSYSMLTADEELCAKLSEAINAMKEDGTLDKLTVQYMTGTGDDTAVDFEEFDGAETLTFAITGDLPPFDYADAAGYACGFNTAVIAEIASRLQVNVQLTSVESCARGLVLSLHMADVVFWTDDNPTSSDAKTSLDYSSETLETLAVPEDEPTAPEGLELPTSGTDEKPESPIVEEGPERANIPEGTYITEPFFYDYSVLVSLAE